MAPQNSSIFYAQMPVQTMRVSELFGKKELFVPVPEDWHIIITDIKKSTEAIRKGAHQNVNLIATGTIIAALNLARKSNITVPFFFGGDGATLIVPQLLLNDIMKALAEHRVHTLKAFGLDLRLGAVPVKEVYEIGFDLSIAKVQVSDVFATPIILGQGLRYAEKIIKAEDFVSFQDTGDTSILDLEGMECRWDKLKPPKETNEVVSLLVEVANEQEQGTVFKEVIEIIDNIYGEPQNRKPISVPHLKLEATLNRIYSEMRVRIRKFNIIYLLTNLLITSIGKVYLKYTKRGQAYLKKLIDLTDTLVMDGRVNTVISGTIAQRKALEKALTDMEMNGKIRFGMHVSQESIMSCYVRRRDDEHIHFVDGGGGGYTQAAKMLKQKA